MAALVAPGTATARVDIRPEVELRQVLVFGEDRGTSAYAEASAGFGATFDRPRLQGNVNYRLSQRIEQTGNVAQERTHNLLGRVGAEVIRRTLFIEAGGFATQLNRDLAGNVSFSPDVDDPNLVQTFSAYVEPRLSEDFGDFAELDVSYRFGIFDVDDDNRQSAGGGTGGRFTVASDSINQTVNARLGNRERSERFRWDLLGNVTDDQAERLDQSYRAYEGRAELELVINRGFSLLGTVGYEDISAKERDVVRQPTGIPVLGPDGDFVLDPSGRRRIVYSESGPIYQGGFRWQPTRRTFIEARAGQRFGEFNVSGAARYQPNPRFVISASLREGIDTNGRVLTQDLSALGRGIVSSVVTNLDLLGTGGCVFGVDPGTGGCLFSATQSLSSALFRNRTADITAEYQRGRTRGGISLIYSQRTFLDLQQIQVPGQLPVDPNLRSQRDQTLTASARVSRELGGAATLSGGVFVSRFRFALLNDRDEYYVGAFGNYDLRLDRRLSARAALNVSQRFSDVVNNRWQGVASAGVAYRF
jgi:hypothetical protein